MNVQFLSFGNKTRKNWKNFICQQKKSLYVDIVDNIVSHTIQVVTGYEISIQVQLHSHVFPFFFECRQFFTFGKPASSHSLINSKNSMARREINSGLNADIMEFNNRALEREKYKSVSSHLLKPIAILSSREGGGTCGMGWVGCAGCDPFCYIMH